MSDMILND